MLAATAAFILTEPTALDRATSNDENPAAAINADLITEDVERALQERRTLLPRVTGLK